MGGKRKYSTSPTIRNRSAKNDGIHASRINAEVVPDAGCGVVVGEDRRHHDDAGVAEGSKLPKAMARAAMRGDCWGFRRRIRWRAHIGGRAVVCEARPQHREQWRFRRVVSCGETPRGKRCCVWRAGVDRRLLRDGPWRVGDFCRAGTFAEHITRSPIVGTPLITSRVFSTRQKFRAKLDRTGRDSRFGRVPGKYTLTMLIQRFVDWKEAR